MKTILAVDGNSIMNRAFYGVRPLTNKDGLYTHAVYGFANMLYRQLTAYRPDVFAVAFDLKAPTFRHKMYDAYKAGRHGMPDELRVQVPYLYRCAEGMGAEILTKEGFEADDILGTVARMAEEDGDAHAYLFTGDRDALQLVSDRVTVLLATNGEDVVFDPAAFREKYGVDPTQFVDVKALMGDSSDNIPGVPGVGEKTAFKFIAQFGTLDGVYENLGSEFISKGVRARLENGKDSAYLSQTLARICREVPIGKSFSDMSYRGFDRILLSELFRELEFSVLIKRFGLDQTPEVREEKISSEQAEEAKNVELGTDDPEALIGGKLAFLYDGESFLFTPDGKTNYSLKSSPAQTAALLDRLHQKGCRLTVCESKKLYHLLPMLPETLIFDYDTELAAYVIDPSDSSYEPTKLKLKYLSEASDSFDPVTLWRLAEATSEIISERGQEKLLFEIELPLARVLAKMEMSGFRVDLAGLKQFSAHLSEAADELKRRIYLRTGEEFNLNSPKQLGEMLFEKLYLPHGKKTKTGYSTNAEILEKLAPDYPIVRDILDYRQLTKLKSTYGDGLAKAADEKGFVHSNFNQTITATGRLSSTEPNLQNIPIKTELGRELRRFFLPDGEGRVLIDADYSQIELRLLAAIAGDETMIEAFKNGEDIHARTASQVFGIPIGQVTFELRKRAKAVNFGIVYGIGEFSLAEDLGISRAEAGAYIRSYMATFPKIAAYLHDIVEQAGKDGYVTTIFGRRRYIPELSSSKKMLRAFGERVAMNSPIQGGAADIIKVAMNRVDRALSESGLDAHLLLQVHDELIVDASAEDAEKAREILTREMENAVSLAVPLTVSGKIGLTWFDAKD